jgi:hypothetical protein
MAERLKNGGLVQSKLVMPTPGSLVVDQSIGATEKPVSPQKSEVPAIKKSSVVNINEIEEGELTEGKEVDLK